MKRSLGLITLDVISLVAIISLSALMFVAGALWRESLDDDTHRSEVWNAQS